MKEKDFQRMFGKWMAEHQDEMLLSTAWELKIVKGNSLPFNRVAEHQEQNLLNAINKGVYHKIADMTFGRAGKFGHTLPKPFDCLYLKVENSYIVLWFYKPRQKKEMIWIPILKWLDCKNECGRKSINEEMAKEIGITYIFS